MSRKGTKKSVKVSISAQMVDRAQLQETLGDEEHKRMVKERNAVEVIPSIFRRKYGINDIRNFFKSRRCSIYFGICFVYNGKSIRSFLTAVG